MPQSVKPVKVRLTVDELENGCGFLHLNRDSLWWSNEQSAGDVTFSFNSISSFQTLGRVILSIVRPLPEKVVNYKFIFETEDELVQVLDFLFDHLKVDRVFDDTEQKNFNGDRVTTVFLKTHVSNLKFIDKFLFAGIGDVLHVYFNDHGKWIFKTTKKIFKGQNIYGIEKFNEKEFVVFGGRDLSFLRIFWSGLEIRVQVVYCFRCQDWILDVVSLEHREIVLLTANNALVLYKLSLLEPVLVSVSYCATRSILYSGKLLGTSWDDIVVLAGTVYSTIIIWANSVGTQAKPIHNLEGHKGVIFSVGFCDVTKRICSTSDDRSVRLWDVVFRDAMNWRDCSIKLKYSLFGHSARVWKSIPVGGMIASVGEDSRVCLWNGDGTLANRWKAHQDGEVWSLDSYNDVIATGGSDGAVILWPVSASPVPKSLDFNETNFTPKCVGLLNSGNLYMMNSTGEMFTYNRDTWKLNFTDHRFSSYCQHALSPNRTLLALGNIQGHLAIYRHIRTSFEKIIDTKATCGRIFNIVWLSESNLVISESEGNFSTWELTLDPLDLRRNQNYILPYSKERWITSCASDGLYLVCGDRLGSLFVYKKNQKSPNPVSTLKKIHGHNGVTNVKFFGGKFVSSGRDGKYREFIIKNDDLFLLRCSKLKYDWVAAVFDDQTLGRILICFHEVHFVIWSVQHRRSILTIDCGGGHRSWDYVIDRETNCIRIAYIKGKTVHYCDVSVDDVLCQVLLPGGHSKAINAAAVVPVLAGILPDCSLVLLGGEDTSLRLVTIGKDLTQLNVLQSHLSSARTVSCHDSKRHNSVFIASGGGRGQIVVWKLYNTQDLLEVVELTSHHVMQAKRSNVFETQFNDDAEMRIMDLQIYETSSGLIHIAAGGSDGVLRIFTLCTQSNSIVTSQEIATGHCLLKVLHFNSTNPFLVTTNTNGNVTFLQFKNNRVTTDLITHSISDLGINSCDVNLRNNRVVVSCAGDSAHVNILVLNDSFQLLNKWTNDAAHFCQVSGMKITEKFLFTAGLDHLLSIFSWNLIDDEVQAYLVSQVKLSVADIHGTLVWKCQEEEYNILVYGLGCQLVRFDGLNSS